MIAWATTVTKMNNESLHSLFAIHVVPLGGTLEEIFFLAMA